MIRIGMLALMALFLVSACDEAPPRSVGLLRSDRVEITVESVEPITAISVREGDRLVAGAVILQQDVERFSALLAEAMGRVSLWEALLEEQRAGPRPEELTRAEASVADAQQELAFRETELRRLEDLAARALTAQDTVDSARRQQEAARARLDIAQAHWDELRAGTRIEQIRQTEAQLAQARAVLARLTFDRARLTVSAPVDGLVDSLPFDVGERPRLGDVVAVLLMGEQPVAEVYVPETLRTRVRIGDTVQLKVDGVDGPVTGQIRSLASEAAFTPYFALTENDRGRLSYRAEIVIAPRSERLPEGLPVELLLGLPDPSP